MMSKSTQPPVGYRSPFLLSGLSDSTPVAVALSGGADSVALLHILSTAPVSSLYAVHVHHGIRGEEADRDADFCLSLCERLGVPLTILRLDVPAIAASTGKSMETAARDARYEAIASFLAENHIPLLATAHHADDQLETILQHLLRGSGLRGLCGIPACRPLGNATVVRPLLLVSKDAVLDYCRDTGLDFVTDSTNAEPCCSRNRLRLEVMPILRELWPTGATRAAHCADLLARDEHLLCDIANDFLAKQGRSPSVKDLADLPLPLFARVMHLLLPSPPETVHIESLFALVQNARPHASLSLPLATVQVENGRLRVKTEKEAPTSPFSVLLTEDQTVFPYGIAHFTSKDAVPDAALLSCYPHYARISFSRAAAHGALSLRSRKEGDRILSGSRHKAIRKLPCMAPFTKAERARLPLLCDDHGILAVPTGPVRDDAKKRVDTVLDLFFR